MANTAMHTFVGYPDACDRRNANSSALRASRPYYLREVDLFACFSRHRARLLRRHPGKACTAACSRARAAGVVAAVCQTVKTSASPIICSKKHETRLSEGGRRKNCCYYYSSSSSFSASQCSEKRNYVCLKTISSTRGERVRSLFRPACPPASTAPGRVCPTAYPMTVGSFLITVCVFPSWSFQQIKKNRRSPFVCCGRTTTCISP